MRFIYSLDAEKLSFGIVIIIILLFVYGFRFDREIHTYKYDCNFDPNKTNGAIEHFERVSKFIKKYGNPYFYLGYLLTGAYLFTFLSPRWIHVPMCQLVADMYTFSKIIGIGGVIFLLKTTKLAEIGYGEHSIYPMICMRVLHSYRIMGISLLVVCLLVMIIGTSIYCP